MTNEEAINIIQTSNDKLAMQIDLLKHGTALLDEDRDSLYQCLEYCLKEHEACNIAIKSLELELKRRDDGNRWIPVTPETMPESGLHVFICCVIRPGKEYVCDGYYAAPKTIVVEDSGDCSCEYDDETDKYYLLEGWYEVIKNCDDFSSIVIDDFVTHWRPLPEPPKGAKG